MTPNLSTEIDRAFATGLDASDAGDIGMQPGSGCSCAPHETLHGAEECFRRRHEAITGGQTGQQAVGLNIFYANGDDLDDEDCEALMWNWSYEPAFCPHHHRTDGRCRWCGTQSGSEQHVVAACE